MSNGSHNSTPGANIVWTTDLIAQTDFMVFRDITTDHITNVVAPNGLQIGLFDDDHIANLNVTGDITGSGEIYALENITANLGFTGSLQKLVDGSNFIQNGSNVIVTNNSDGSITIAANAAATTGNSLTVGTGIQFAAGSGFDGSSAREVAVDINGVSTVDAIATDDAALIYDTSTSTVKKVTVANLRGSGLPLEIAGQSNSLTHTSVAKGDIFAIADINDSNEVKKITLDEVSQWLSGETGGASGLIQANNGTIRLDLKNLLAANLDPAADFIAFMDESQANDYTRKESVADFVAAIRGTASTTALTSTGGVLSLDINNLNSATVASDDELVIYDTDAAALKKVAVSSVGGAPTDAQYVVLAANGTLSNETVLAAGDGLDLSGATFSTDLKSSAGLKIVDTELAIEPADFAGTGLEDDGSDNLRISAAAAGTGLSGGAGSALSVQYGTSAGTAAAGNNTFTINAGDGLSGGGSLQPIGANISYTLDVQATDFTGTGLSVSGNDIHAYLKGDSNISITTGSESVLGINLDSDISISKITAPHITGSLTKLSNGTSYLIAGDNISITTGSSGAVTIATNADILSVTAGDGLTGGGTTGALTVNVGAGTGISINANDVAIDNSIVATLTGSVFSGPVLAPSLTGSLTRLTDGTAYIIAGNNVTIATGSSGAITINATSADGGAVGTITGITAGSGLTGGGANGSVTLNIGSGTGITVNADDITTNDSQIVHDNLSGFVANEHVDHSSVSITAGSGLTGGGDITTTRTLNIGTGTGITVNANDIAINNSVVATLSGSQFSGNVGITGSLGVRGGLSGSLTHLADGSSYLVAGSGIAITSGSSGAVTIATSAAPGILGAAEDSDYTDGLFTDFTTSTPVGTAVDRFNEVLKGLAPSAAPALDDIDCSDSGTNAKLSFGNSQSISGYTNARPSTLSPASNLSDIDINGTYNSTSASNDLRIACFGAITTINGTLNQDVSADGSNYNANSFADGNLGTLKLFVNNNSTPIHTTDLSSFGSGNSLNGNGSGFNLSATTPGHFSDGSNFATFQHRQGTYTINAGEPDQKKGWNYARVVHTVGGSDRVCNYVEWINDPTGAGVAMSTSGASLGSLSMTGTKNLSGVKYHTGGSAAYSITIANAYRNVYPTGNITFGGSNTAVSSQGVPTINHGAGEDETKSIALSNLVVNITGDPILNGSISVNTSLTHPLKSNLSSAGNQSISGILLYNLSDNSTSTTETFRGETNRMKNAAYNAQGDVGGSNVWDSADSLLSIDGLLIYNDLLVAPNQGANGGNFSGITNGPGSNVNYSSITSGTRTYFRKFTNTSGGSKTNFNLTLNGSGTIVASGGTLNSSNIKVFCKMPSNGSSSTGWMDLATAFSSGQVSDNDGCLVGSLQPNISLSPVNEVTFGTQTVGSSEYIIIKVLADGAWTGNISQMSISWV